MTPRLRFILRFGVLAYGGGLFVLFNVLHIARLRAHGASLAGLPLWLLMTALIAGALGYAFGVFAWKRARLRGH